MTFLSPPKQRGVEGRNHKTRWAEEAGEGEWRQCGRGGGRVGEEGPGVA